MGVRGTNVTAQDAFATWFVAESAACHGFGPSTPPPPPPELVVDVTVPDPA
jgi:hypothetical protein